jgi:predicted dehydrogenase
MSKMLGTREQATQGGRDSGAEVTGEHWGERKAEPGPARRPRLGFLGVGWIGLNRLEAIAKAGVAEIAALADPSREMAARAGAVVPRAAVKECLEDLLNSDLDGLVIATPSALHPEQTVRALERGLAVFCQKPLARTESETRAVIDAARRADRLLGVDLSYRFLSGAQRIRELIGAGELGRIFAVEMRFHNAYGPDKAWFYNRKLSGGGCVIDLGIHLVDLALWTLHQHRVAKVVSCLFAGGGPWQGEGQTVEDYATARLDLETGTAVQLACSWKLPAGRDAIIDARFYGTRGGAALRNVNGSFYQFAAERFRGTVAETLSSGPEEWGGRAAVAWAKALGKGQRFDPEIETLLPVMAALDRVYGRKSLQP